MTKALKEYPKFKSPDDREYDCIGHACDIRTSWEWYLLEKETEDIYFAYVIGFESEFGSVSLKELTDNGVRVTFNKAVLNEILPPIGWQKI